MPAKKQTTTTGNVDIDDVMAMMNKKFGNASLMRVEDAPDVEVLSTGIPDIDALIGGGFIKGRLYEIFGEENAGKTILAMYTAKLCSSAVWFNTDHRFDPARYVQLGGNPHTLVKDDDNQLSHVGEKMLWCAKAGVDLIVVDTVAALVPDQVIKGGSEAMGDKSAVAPLAAFFSEKLSLILNEAYKSGTVVLFLNRVSQNINVTNKYAYPYSTVGGHHKNSLCAARLAVGRGQKLDMDISVKDASGKSSTTTVEYGYTMAVKTFRSSVSAPNKRAEAAMVYTHGLVLPDQLAAVKEQFRIAYREQKLLSAGQTTITEEMGE